MPRGMIVPLHWSLLLLGMAILGYTVWYAVSGDILPPVSNYVTIPLGLEGGVYSLHLILAVVLAIGLLCGLIVVLTSNLLIGLRVGLAFGLGVGLVIGLGAGLAYGLITILSFVLCCGLGMLSSKKARWMVINWLCAR